MQEADVDIMAIAIQAEQLDRIDFSYPIGLNPFRMIVPAPVEKSRLFAFIRPFQPKVQIFKKNSKNSIKLIWNSIIT